MADLDGNGAASSCNDDPGGAPDPGILGAPSDARYWVGSSHAGLSEEHNLGVLATGLVVNTAGTPSAVARGTNGHVLTMVGGVEAWAAPTGGGAPVGSSYVVISLDGTLTSERALAVTSGHLTLTDGGANANVSLGLPNVGGGAAVGGALSLLTTVTPDAQGRVSSAAAVAGTANQVARVNSGGTAVGFGLLVDANIDAAAAIAFSKLATIGTSGVLGSAAGGTAPAAITTSTEGHVLRRNSGSVGFGTINNPSSFAGTTTNGFVLTIVSGVPTWQAAAGGTVDGSGAATRVTFWSDADTLTSDAGFTFGSNTLSVSLSASGAAVTSLLANTSNTASATALDHVQVAGATASDAMYRVSISGGQAYTWGLDNSDSDAFVGSVGTALGTTNFLRVVAGRTTLQTSSGNFICDLNDSSGAVFGYAFDRLILDTTNIGLMCNAGYAVRASGSGSDNSGNQNLELFGATEGYGSGSKVMKWNNCIAEPTGDPTAGGLEFWASSIRKLHDPTGMVTLLN